VFDVQSKCALEVHRSTVAEQVSEVSVGRAEDQIYLNKDRGKRKQGRIAEAGTGTHRSR
jgi:hypothetical protein